MQKANLKKAPHKGFLLAMAVFILVGLIFNVVNTKHLVHPVMHWIVVLAISVGYALFVWRYANNVDNEDAGKTWWKLLLPTVLFFVISYGISLLSKDNRSGGIPKGVLVYNNGHIENPDEYIAFHKQVTDNKIKIHFDAETEAFIKANNELPEWVVIGRYTADPVGWIRAHPNADAATKDKVLRTREVIPIR